MLMLLLRDVGGGVRASLSETINQGGAGKAKEVG